MDKSPTNVAAIKELKEEGICTPEIRHWQVKYLNNIVQADHGKLKRLIKPTLVFKSMKTAYATIKGFELMRMFKKGQTNVLHYDQGIIGEVCFIERQFGLYAI